MKTDQGKIGIEENGHRQISSNYKKEEKQKPQPPKLQSFKMWKH